MERRYGEDLSYIHDVGYSDLAETAAICIDGWLRERGITNGLIVELGCGSGVTAAHLLASGHSVIGIDASSHMIDLARRRAPDGVFRTASFATEPLPECDAVVAVNEVFNYRFDEDRELGSLAPFFERVREALRPSGLFTFDLHTPGRHEGGRVRAFRVEPDWAVMHEANEDLEQSLMTRSITTFRLDGDGSWRRSDEHHSLRLVDPATTLQQLRSAGFDVETQSGYGREQRRADLSVFVASPSSATTSS
jgi:SAM-dependent methyltransferase